MYLSYIYFVVENKLQNRDECSSKRTEKGKCETVYGKIMDEYCTQVPLPKEKCEILHDFMHFAKKKK